jgi:hypothetical protein
MHFSEDDLRKALRREDPGPAFTQRVMARINQQQEAKAKAAQREPKRFAWLRWLAVRPAWSAAAAALVLLIGIGLGYWQYERVQEEKRQEAAKAKEAERQVMLALRITNAKLNHVFKRVNEPAAPEPGQEPKIRRQSL